ncbi:MAG TPA: hypothetical protein VK797_19470 [Tepidisphaeraceae bacterium]|nr:hypothetical protein [Tepidisphaeraceae bacterium]
MRRKLQRRSGFTFAQLLVVALVVAAKVQRPALADKAPQTRPNSDDIVVVHGRVQTPDGKPAAGAQVFAAPYWPNRLDAGRPAFVSRTTAGANGRFQVSFSKSAVSPFALGYGESGADLWQNVQIAASASGFGMDWQAFDHRDPAGDVVLQLVADVPIKGRIIDLEGRPVPGTTVTVQGVASHIFTPKSPSERRPENFRGIGHPLAATGQADTVVSDADGRFEISGLGRDRRATLTFVSDQVAVPRQWVGTREGKTSFKLMGSIAREASMEILGSTFELTAPPARSVTGIVRDAQTHQPVRNVHVLTTYSRIDVATVTDAEGRYRLSGLERGQHIEITARSDDEPYLPAVFDLPEKTQADPLSHDIELTRGIWIKGKVVDGQTGAAVAASVNYAPLAANKTAAAMPLFQRGSAQWPCNTQTAPDGTFRLIGASGAGVVAVLVPLSTDYPPGQGFASIKSKDARGGVATVSDPSLSPNFYTAAREIDAAPDAPTSGIDFILSRGGTVHLVCSAGDGRPVQKLWVFGRSASRLGLPPLINGGEFDVVGLRPGQPRLVVIRDDDHRVGKTIKIDPAEAGKTVQVQLEPMGSVTGRLLSTQQTPISGGKLRIDTAVVELRQANHIAVEPDESYSGPDGRFRIDMPVGCPYLLAASISPFGGEFKFFQDNLITLKPGEVKDMGDLQLDPRMMQ